MDFPGSVYQNAELQVAAWRQQRAPGPAVAPAPLAPSPAELIAHNGDEFLVQATRLIWGRKPGPKQLRHLRNRLAETRSKAAVLWDLRLRYEGRLQGSPLQPLLILLPAALIGLCRQRLKLDGNK